MDKIDYRKRRRWMQQNNLEPDLDNLRDLLRLFLNGIKFDRADILAEKWFRGEPAPGSDWTREAELERWITAAEDDPIAWEGCRRLLKELGHEDVPPALSRWANNVAAKRIEEPQLEHGQHATDYVWRNARIAKAVEVCRSAGLTIDDACAEVGDVLKSPQAFQIHDIYKEIRKIGGFLDGISISVSACRNKKGETISFPLNV